MDKMKIDIELYVKLKRIIPSLECYKLLGKDNEYLIEDTKYVIEELLSEIENLKYEAQQREQDIENNYRRIPVAEQVEVYDRDFIC